MPTKRKQSRDASPPRPLTATEFLARVLEEWPTLSIRPGHEEIENPESDLAKLRASCVLTASRAGVLWNCKRGLTLKRFMEESLGLEEPRPFTEWTKQLMEAGQREEPLINKTVCAVMAAELKRINGASLHSWLPGPYAAPPTSATPDGLWTWRVWDAWYVMPYEIKFFASKNELPTTLPADYIAQVLMQMWHAKSRISVLVGAVVADGVKSFRVWKLRANPAHFRDYNTRLENLQSSLAAKRVVTRAPNEGTALADVVVGYTSDCTDVWEFILQNLGLLPHLRTGSGPFLFPK